MYKIDVINNCKHIVTFVENQKDFVFCSVAEANEKDTNAYNNSRWFSNIFTEALKFISSDILSKDLPKVMAIALKKVLIEFRKETGPDGILYAGVTVENNKIYICTAGNCRVHVVGNNEIKFITRDHNLIDDSSSESKPTENILFYKTIPTRAIALIEMDKSPECNEVLMEKENKVVICTSNFHRFREPKEYIETFIEEEISNLPEYKENLGVIIKIQELE